MYEAMAAATAASPVIVMFIGVVKDLVLAILYLFLLSHVNYETVFEGLSNSPSPFISR
jgi:hypothetical protein